MKKPVGKSDVAADVEKGGKNTTRNTQVPVSSVALWVKGMCEYSTYPQP